MGTNLIEIDNIHRYATESRPAYNELNVATIISTTPVQTTQHFSHALRNLIHTWKIIPVGLLEFGTSGYVQREICRVEKTTGTSCYWSRIYYLAEVKSTERRNPRCLRIEQIADYLRSG